MVSVDPSHGRYIACSLLYSGDVIPREVVSAVSSIKSKRTVSFVDWVPTGFKVSINRKAPLAGKDDSLGSAKRSCCLLSNNLAID